jgi:uncharacterized protein (TIGR03382 family)
MTDVIAQHGVYAVFVLMAVDAVLPASSELVMLYAGVLAAGAISGQHATLFGAALSSGARSYVVLSLAGALGSLVGALAGWWIGAAGGRSFIERHGRWLHVSPPQFARAEAWFKRYGRRTLFLGRITPVVRSFISIPAGALGSPLGSYTVLTLLGSLVWCFAFAGIGWAVGASWASFHQSFSYAGYTAAGALLLLALAALAHRRRQRSAGA